MSPKGELNGRVEPSRTTRFSSFAVRALGALCVAGSLSGCLKTPDRFAASSLDVSMNPPANFELDGKPLCFAGANNYYLASKPRPMVDDVLQSAKALGFPVVRIWGYLDIGSLDGSVGHVDPWGDKVTGKKDGIYFQYWDPQQKRPLYNEGEDGLPKLDYVMAKAGELGIKIILVLTNNWYDFGGMDQYLTWYGRKKHHEFYTEPEVKQAFKNWIQHLVTRKNTVNGKLYRDDPAIFSWELGNEPRCKGTGPASTGWTTQTLVTWADEMSSYIKSLDSNHMVSVGDEGFLNGGGEHWAYKANDGVDHEALTALPGIDFGTYHSYPEDWGANLSWGDRWIVDHQRVARRLGKPTVLEEYGIKVTRNDNAVITSGLESRLKVYERWNALALSRGGNATMIWMLGGLDTLYPAPNGLYHDYDGYTVFRGDESANLLADVARRFATEAPACRSAAPSTSPPSPFVRAQRTREAGAPVAFGWGLSDG
ncbi:MAG TPA: cellulase family glycosylhydrolase [Polyangiaceae bacterium]|jgi:mannan endo-1,4-beta-mannosidase|nr:cellulase family glycosylhydrolase [Polyangiaceae bacterium]